MRKTYKYCGFLTAAAVVLLASFAQSANIEHFKHESNNGLQSTSGQLLAQVDSSAAKSRSSRSSSSCSGDNCNGDLSFPSFVIGSIMIPFALVLLWKNEKKVVTFAKCMD